MKRLIKTTMSACVAGVMFTGSAQAALITTSAPLGPSAVIDFQQFSSVAFANAVPVQVGVPVGEDVEMFGLGTFDSYVGIISYSLGGNGQWLTSADVNFRSAYLPVSTSLAMEFAFNTGPVRGVGGFMNYAPGFGPVLIEAYDAGGSLLEAYDLTSAAAISTGPTSINQGAFRGILRAAPDISRFRVSASFAVLDNLTFTRVPEPASVLVLGLGGVGLLTREGRK
jgi:PEP-CTERM motif-containing protein